MKAGLLLSGLSAALVACSHPKHDVTPAPKEMELQPATPGVEPVAPAEPGEPGDDMQAAIDAGIKKIDATTYDIDKDLVEKALMNPMAVAKGARVVPFVKDGKAAGFKLYAIKPTSVFARLGFENGDVLTEINGFELTTADKALEVYTKLREATNLEVAVLRAGRAVTFKYTVR